jgi:hypothetical protein
LDVSESFGFVATTQKGIKQNLNGHIISYVVSCGGLGPGKRAGGTAIGPWSLHPSNTCLNKMILPSCSLPYYIGGLNIYMEY